MRRKLLEDERIMRKWPDFPFPILKVLVGEGLMEPFLEDIKQKNLIARIWQKDSTLWKQPQEEILNRLGWLEVPLEMLPRVPEIKNFAFSLKESGFNHALLLGMGGSSLTPEVLNQIFPSNSNSLKLEILDSSVPEAIIFKDSLCPPHETIYIVSSKSGTTTETVCLFSYFFARALKTMGKERAPAHFMAITDPSTPLASKACSLKLRKIWLANPAVGGRFSALTLFGLLPAALKGIDILSLLESAKGMMAYCQNEKVEENPGAIVAAFLAAVEAQGRNKLLFWIEPELDSLGDWLEQLVAESTGKQKKGLLPVVGQQELLHLLSLEDVAFIGMGSSRSSFNSLLETLSQHETPSLLLAFEPRKEIGAFFFLWEWAISLASSFWLINPFDQPDVEKTKVFTREILKNLKAKGDFPPLGAKISADGLILYSSNEYSSVVEGISEFLKAAQKASYLSLQAFLAPSQEIKLTLRRIVMKLIRGLRRPITLGWGPRYLHSTGQFHKGGSENGLFWQLIAEDDQDLIIPESPGEKKGWLSFGSLKEAQARADYLALSSLGKRIIHLNLGRDYLASLEKIEKIIDSFFPF